MPITEIETVIMERATETPARTPLDVCNLFDFLAGEMYYGMNVKLELMEISTEDYEALWAIARRFRNARQPR